MSTPTTGRAARARTVRSSHGLERRDVAGVELMDDPACDLRALHATYRRFVVVNRLVAGWRRQYVRRLRPLLSPTTVTTLLDVGSGGGDVARALLRWARRDGLLLRVTAIDPDPRAHAWASRAPSYPDLTLRPVLSTDLVREGARFDVVISNHVLHHLDAVTLATLLADSDALATRLVLHSDIARGRLAYAGWWVGTLPFLRTGRPHASFIRDDGLLSIRRSYRPAELASLLPTGWTVERAPFRVLAVHLPTATSGAAGSSGA